MSQNKIVHFIILEDGSCILQTVSRYYRLFSLNSTPNLDSVNYCVYDDTIECRIDINEFEPSRCLEYEELLSIKSLKEDEYPDFLKTVNIRGISKIVTNTGTYYWTAINK